MNDEELKENKEMIEENEMPFCTEPEDPEYARLSKEEDPCKIS